MQVCLEKSLKIEIALKSTWKTLKKSWKVLEFYHLQGSGGFNTVFCDLNQYEIAVPLFGAAYAAPNKGTTIAYSFSKIYIFSNAVYHFKNRILMCKSVFFISLQSLKTVGKSFKSQWILHKLACLYEHAICICSLYITICAYPNESYLPNIQLMFVIHWPHSIP